MPSYSLTMVATSGFGIGVIAGIVSGVCYVIIHGFVGRRNKSFNDTDTECPVCKSEFALFMQEAVVCMKCHKRVCKYRCSTPSFTTFWTCETCKNAETWYEGLLQKFNYKNMNSNAQSLAGEPEPKVKEQVKDFIERLVEAMLGRNIDNTSVNQIYDNENYDRLILKYRADLSDSITDLGSALHVSIANLPIIGQSPCAAHASLKLLIRKIVQEAIGLPKLKKVKDHPTTAKDEDANRTYENLLATAILNKVIQNYQDEVSTVSNKSSASLQNGEENYCKEANLNLRQKNATDIDSTSVSSIEEWMLSEHVDPTPLKIRELSSSDNDDSTSALGAPKIETKTWQDNWLMQKRRLGDNRSPVPVPMLVPNPSVEAKVLIGDREAEDTTDLSDAASEIEDTESTMSMEHILIDSKTIIGGKNLLNNVNIHNGCEGIEETRHSTSTNEQNMDSVETHMEQDAEYTERYATLPKTILKDLDDEDRQENLLQAHDKFEGTYSEREKQKWNNAVEMKNNPYTSENLKQRLNNSENKFRRNLYVRNSTSPTGIIDDAAKGKNETRESRETLFKAIPAMADDRYFQIDAVASASLKPNVTDLSSDSDLSVERTYNIDSGRVYEKIGAREIIDGSKSPQGVKYLTKNSEFDKLYDENHNSTIVNRESLDGDEITASFRHSTSENKKLDLLDSEILSLKDQQLVKNRLGHFSKSHPSLENISSHKETSKIQTSSSIRNLKQLFDSDKNSQNFQHIHSLTARSIPQQLKQELKTKDSDSTFKDLISYKSEQEIETFPDAKCRIEFFENLNH